MITLYQQHDSGNCYKVRLLLSHLGRPFRTVAVSSRDGSTRRPEFLMKNPIGRVPTIALEDGRFLAESDAILLHLAKGTRLLPADAYERAKTYEWLFFEQYEHENSEERGYRPSPRLPPKAGRTRAVNRLPRA